MFLINGIQEKQNSDMLVSAYCTSIEPLFWNTKIKEEESKFISDM